MEYPKKGNIGNMSDMKEKLTPLLERFKLPIVLLALGLVFMLIPGNEVPENISKGNDSLVAEMLSQVQGVGKANVLISDKGVVVVCQGADKAKTRMEIIQAISSYTGDSSDKITILKMVD